MYHAKPDVSEFPTSTNNSWTEGTGHYCKFYFLSSNIASYIHILHWTLQVFVNCCLCRSKDSVMWCDVTLKSQFVMMWARENLDNEDSSWWLSSLIWWSTLSSIRFKFWNSQSKYKSQQDQISAKYKIQSVLSSVLYFGWACLQTSRIYKLNHQTAKCLNHILFMIFSNKHTF